ncbi:MAG: HNH endonuclease signature motif containing protein [Terriglobia bacterium]
MGKKSKQIKLPDDLLRRIKAVKAKRPRTVLSHILKHGHITTEELQDLYGYEHPPRAARDVREHGIPLETFSVRDKKGRKIAAYRLDLTVPWEELKAGGRKAFSKEFKAQLVDCYGSTCASCGVSIEPRYLQIDHRVPYEVAGERAGVDPTEFMLLCPSCNRTKSWTCEHCRNWRQDKKAQICQSCYWGDPTRYSHIALVEMRRVEICWAGEEVTAIDGLRRVSEEKGISIQQAIKDIVREHSLTKQG